MPITTFNEPLWPPQYKYAPTLYDGTVISGHGCYTREELEEYCNTLGMTLAVVPTDDMDAAMGYMHVIPAETPIDV